MTLLLPRRGFLAGLASLLAAPAIVRASSLDLVRGIPLEAAITTSYASEESLNYSYWVVRFGQIERMTARDILAAPAGVISPWLVDAHSGGFRPTDEAKTGLLFASCGGSLQVRNIADDLDTDPVIAKLRSERKDLSMEQAALERSLARVVQETAREAVARANNGVGTMPAKRLEAGFNWPRHGVVTND